MSNKSPFIQLHQQKSNKSNKSPRIELCRIKIQQIQQVSTWINWTAWVEICWIFVWCNSISEDLLDFRIFGFSSGDLLDLLQVQFMLCWLCFCAISILTCFKRKRSRAALIITFFHFVCIFRSFERSFIHLASFAGCGTNFSQSNYLCRREFTFTRYILHYDKVVYVGLPLAKLVLWM